MPLTPQPCMTKAWIGRQRGRSVARLSHLLKCGNHVPPVVLHRAVGCQLQAAVQHWAAQAVKPHRVHVVRARVCQAGSACDVLHISLLPPVQCLLQPLHCLCMPDTALTSSPQAARADLKGTSTGSLHGECKRQMHHRNLINLPYAPGSRTFLPAIHSPAAELQTYLVNVADGGPQELVDRLIGAPLGLLRGQAAPDSSHVS